MTPTTAKSFFCAFAAGFPLAVGWIAQFRDVPTIKVGPVRRRRTGVYTVKINGHELCGHLIKYGPCGHNTRFLVRGQLGEHRSQLEWTMLDSEVELMAAWLAKWIVARFVPVVAQKCLPPPPVGYTDSDGGHPYVDTFYAWTKPAWEHYERCPAVVAVRDLNAKRRASCDS